jgi:uncharacterized membrane protein
MHSWQTLSLLVHLLALALWFGSMAFFLVVFAPAVNQIHAGTGIHALNKGRISFEALSWIAILLLFLSGATNLIMRLEGAAVQTQLYFVILIIKLVLFAAMLINHCLQVFMYAPDIAALTTATPVATAIWPDPLRAAWGRWFLLLKINAGLAPLVTLLGLALMQH